MQIPGWLLRDGHTDGKKVSPLITAQTSSFEAILGQWLSRQNPGKVSNIYKSLSSIFEICARVISANMMNSCATLVFEVVDSLVVPVPYLG